jgi:hypothetical protein
MKRDDDVTPPAHRARRSRHLTSMSRRNMLRDFARSFAGAILAIAAAPIIFVAGPPLAAVSCVRMLHWRELVARGHRDGDIRFELEDVRSARAWRHDDADECSHVLLELVLADGRRIIRADTAASSPASSRATA